MTAGRATFIVFSDDDLPPEGLDHRRSLMMEWSLIPLRCLMELFPFMSTEMRWT
uniref:Uncharacterized protein n=1 Tax=Vitis vinifera TaxID=29760 RepID=F6HZX9_VITVI